eukprot:TRINITY_DN672_c0_g1_i5.p1 TRINITY_DN672_c0_g1~~TRINITY_DN672_c0_g1_i5.p1  ORF type:complete len:1260 (+),score=253.54 TRINITY_DN672_c0_g1_i5:269-3781(+)
MQNGGSQRLQSAGFVPSMNAYAGMACQPAGPAPSVSSFTAMSMQSPGVTPNFWQYASVQTPPLVPPPQPAVNFSNAASVQAPSAGFTPNFDGQQGMNAQSAGFSRNAGMMSQSAGIARHAGMGNQSAGRHAGMGNQSAGFSHYSGFTSNIAGFTRKPNSQPDAEPEPELSLSPKESTVTTSSSAMELDENFPGTIAPGVCMYAGEISKALQQLEEVFTAGFITEVEYQERKDKLRAMVPVKAATIPVTGARKSKGNWRPNKKRDRNIRLFLSSTFRDMQAERDYLVKNTFPKIRESCAKRAISFSEIDLRWGVTAEQSESGEVLGLCLEEIDNCRPYFLSLIGDRYGYVPRTIRPEIVKKYPFIANLPYPCSVTEMEVLYGALNDVQEASRALFYTRDISVSSAEGGDNEEKLNDLKRRVRVSGLPLKFYKTPAELSSYVMKDLEDQINGDFPKEEDPDPTEVQNNLHEVYAENKRRGYVPRNLLHDEITKRLFGDGHGTGSSVVVVTGASGMGKSSLLANWCLSYTQDCSSNDLVISHFISCSSETCTFESVVGRVMNVIRREFEIVDQLPADSKEMAREFPRWLSMVPPSVRLVMVVDGLHHLDDVDAAQELRWLPETFPTNVKLLTSAATDSVPYNVICKRNWNTLSIPSLTRYEKEQTISQYLNMYGKSFEKEQEERIVCDDKTSVPLFLHVLLEELRLFGVYEQLNKQIAWYLEARDTVTLFDKTLQRLEQDYDASMVRQALSLICVSRRGCSVKELLDIIGVSRVTFTPFLISIREYLTERAGLLTFFHSHMRGAVVSRYGTQTGGPGYTEAASKLAEYFEQGEGNNDKRRKADELPLLLLMCNQMPRLVNALCDLGVFLELYTQTRKYELKHYWLCCQRSINANVGGSLALAVTKYEATKTEAVDTARTIMRVARFLREMLDYREAEKMLRKAITINTKANGEYSSTVGKAYYLLAEVFWNEGKLVEAEPYALKSLAIREKVLGENHLHVAMSCCGIGELLIEKDPPRAKQYLERALQIRLSHFGPDHPLIARCLQDLSLIADNEGDSEKAVQLCTRACEIREKALGPFHPHLATGLETLAATYKLKGEPGKAETLLLRALNINLLIHGEAHPSVESCHRWLQVVYKDLHRDADSLKHQRLADAVKAKLASLNIKTGERVDDS